jgi:hypothetical protein
MITVVIIATVEWRRRNPLELDAHPHWEAKRWKKAKRKGTNRVAVQVKRRGRSNLVVGLVRSFVRSFIPHCAIVIHFTLNVLQNISSSSSPPARDCVTLHFLSRFFV